MDLKEYERVKYSKDTIYEALCHLAFPPILKISADEYPVAFQEMIREDYPEYKKTSQKPPSEMPHDVVEAMVKNGMARFGTYHHFTSDDGIWKVTLNKDFLSLANLGNYDCYEDYIKRFKRIAEGFSECYKPSSYSRIGLRYRNIISKSTLGLEKAIDDWSKIIPENVLSEFYQDKAKDTVSAFERVLNLSTEEENIILIHTLGQSTGDFKGVKLNNEMAYFIDIDCYFRDKFATIEEVYSKLEVFKPNITNLFRHSLTEELNDLLEPIKSE